MQHNLILLRSNEEKLQSKERDVQDYASRLARARLHSQAKDVRDAIQETSFFGSHNLLQNLPKVMVGVLRN